MSAHSNHPEDRNAAFTGLIVGAVLLAVMVFGIVRMTNSIYSSHETPAAQAAK